MRLFVGIELNGPALEHVLAIRERLVERITRQGVRFVRPEKLHLTLVFLGDVEESNLDALKFALDNLSPTHPFKLETNGVGCFPDMRRPKVVWVGVSGETEKASELATRVAAVAKPLSPNMDEKPFSSHITLARISPGSKEVGRLIQHMNFHSPAAELRVGHFTLFQSCLVGTYDKLHQTLLAD